MTLSHNFKFFCKCPLCTKADPCLDKLISRWTKIRLKLQCGSDPQRHRYQSENILKDVCSCEKLLKNIGMGNQFVKLDLYKVAVKVLNQTGPLIDKLKIMRKLWVQMRLMKCLKAMLMPSKKSGPRNNHFFLQNLSIRPHENKTVSGKKKTKKTTKKKKRKKKKK